MKIIIADDHWVVRKGVRQTLQDHFGNIVIGEAQNGFDLMEEVLNNDWDIVILDLSLPDVNGLDILMEIKRRKDQVKVLILTMNNDEEIALRALKTGASGFLTKDSVPDELCAAVKKIIEGGRYLSPAIAEAIAFSSDKNSRDFPHKELSKREFQVFCLIASGNSIKQISELLCINVKTVGTYRTRILEKLQLKSNVDISHYAIKHKLIITA